MSDDAGFVARWSRRKAQVRSGEVTAEPPAAPATAASSAATAEHGGVNELAPVAASSSVVARPLPLPTLEDVARLTHDSDFSRFVLPGIDETVKRAAMKKLFSDPHFNVMDGLDTYIDDYGIPDPIPDAMLRRMAQSKVLRLFDEDLPPAEGNGPVVLPPEASPDGAAAPALPQSQAGESGVDAPEPDHPTDENPALRLQPDDAAGPAGAGQHRTGARP